MSPSFDITLQPLAPADREALRAEWEDLTIRSDATFFTSWGWIGPWLDTLPTSIQANVLRATMGELTVALAVVCTSTLRRRGVLTVRTVALNATGRPDLDLVAIEHNGFVVDRSLAEDLRGRLFDFLSSCRPDWEEIAMPGCGHPLPFDDAAVAPNVVRREERISPFVELDKVRASGGMIKVLSTNGRSKVRRGLRDYETLGPLKVEVAPSLDVANDYLSELIRLHQHHWTSRGEAGAFAEPWFVDFHRAVVAAGFDRGEIQLCRVAAGDSVVGYTYSFVRAGRVLNYQNGFDYSLLDGRGIPGFVSHFLLAETNAELGHDVYDFLAGPEDHKQRLGTGVNPMTWVVIQRPALKFRLEDRGRVLRGRLVDLARTLAKVPVRRRMNNLLARAKALRPRS